MGKSQLGRTLPRHGGDFWNQPKKMEQLNHDFLEFIGFPEEEKVDYLVNGSCIVKFIGKEDMMLKKTELGRGVSMLRKAWIYEWSSKIDLGRLP
jgi:hypothetical protein